MKYTLKAFISVLLLLLFAGGASAAIQVVASDTNTQATNSTEYNTGATKFAWVEISSIPQDQLINASGTINVSVAGKYSGDCGGTSNLRIKKNGVVIYTSPRLTGAYFNYSVIVSDSNTTDSFTVEGYAYEIEGECEDIVHADDFRLMYDYDTTHYTLDNASGDSGVILNRDTSQWQLAPNSPIPQSWWRLDRPVSTNFFYDSNLSGNSLYDPVTPVQVTGVHGNALLFNGSTQYLQSTSSSYNITGKTFSMGTWYKSPTGGFTSVGTTAKTFMSKYDADVNNDDGWRWYGFYGFNTQFIRFYNGSSIGAGGVANINDSAWHYLTAIGNGSYVQLGVNCTNDGTAGLLPNNFVADTSLFNIGAINSSSSYLEGTIDEPRFENGVAWNTSTCQAYMNNTMVTSGNVTTTYNYYSTLAINSVMWDGSNQTDSNVSIYVNQSEYNSTWSELLQQSLAINDTIYSISPNYPNYQLRLQLNGSGTATPSVSNVSIFTQNYSSVFISPTILNGRERWNKNNTEIKISNSNTYDATLYVKLQYGEISSAVGSSQYHPTVNFTMNNLSDGQFNYSLNDSTWSTVTENLLEDGRYWYMVSMNTSGGVVNTSWYWTYIDLYVGWEDLTNTNGGYIFLHQNNSNGRYLSSNNINLSGYTLVEPEFYVYPVVDNQSNLYTRLTHDYSGIQVANFTNLTRCYNSTYDTYIDRNTACVGTESNPVVLGKLLNEWNSHLQSVKRYVNASNNYITLTNWTVPPDGYAFDTILGYGIPSGMLNADIVYLNNSVIKVGINTRFGGGIVYASVLNSNINMVNNIDVGRSIQSTFWEGSKPWLNWYPGYGGSGTLYTPGQWQPNHMGTRYGEAPIIDYINISSDNKTMTTRLKTNNYEPDAGVLKNSKLNQNITFWLDDTNTVIYQKYEFYNNGTGELYNHTLPDTWIEDDWSVVPVYLGNGNPATFISIDYIDRMVHRNLTGIYNISLDDADINLYGWAWYDSPQIYGACVNETNYGIGSWNWDRPAINFGGLINNTTSSGVPADGKSNYSEYSNPYCDISVRNNFSVGAPGSSGVNYARTYIGDLTAMDIYFMGLDFQIDYSGDTLVNQTTTNASVTVGIITTGVALIDNSTLYWTNSTGTYFLNMDVTDLNTSASITMSNLSNYNYSYLVSSNATTGASASTSAVWTNVLHYPASITNASTATGNFWINNTWTNPADADFNFTMFLYDNGSEYQNVSGPTNFLNITYSPHYVQNISAQTVDTSGNINQTKVWFNSTVPGIHSISNLTNVTTESSINWSWTNPDTLYFNYTIIYIDGIFIENTSNSSYMVAFLTGGEIRTISTYTVDIFGNINTTWVNQSTTIGNYTPTNYIRNGGFELGYTNWTFYTNGNYTYSTINTTSPYAGNNSSKISIVSPGTNTQLYQSSLTLYTNTTYRLSFAAKSSTGKDFAVYIIKHTSPYTSYSSIFHPNISTNWQLFEHDFNTSGLFSGIVNDGRLIFYFNAYDSSNTEYYLDNISLNILNYIPPVPTLNSTVIGLNWINHSWNAGTGSNITDSYNVSVNGIWTNGSIQNYNNSTLSPLEWNNITVYAYNSTNGGELSLTALSVNTQLPEENVSAPNITSNLNNITSDNSTEIIINVNNTALFLVGANQTISNWSWIGSTQVGGNGTINSTASKLFSVVGDTSVSVNGTNSNGTTSTLTWTIHVVADGGGGDNWDFLTGTINVSGATITTNPNVGSTTGGAYSFGYVFLDGNSYWINVSKAGYTSNNTLLLFDEDHEILDINLTLIPVGNASPIISSWSNTNTSDSTTSLTLESGTNITFNVTANQTMTSWSWTTATQINGTGSNESYASHNFTSSGTVSVTGTNGNGSTQTITWTITIPSEIPTSSDNNIYISKENEVMSINLSTNNIDYKIILMNKITSQIRIVNDRIIFTTDNTLYNVNKTSGEIVAKYYFDRNVGIYDPTNNNITKVII